MPANDRPGQGQNRGNNNPRGGGRPNANHGPARNSGQAGRGAPRPGGQRPNPPQSRPPSNTARPNGNAPAGSRLPQQSNPTVVPPSGNVKVAGRMIDLPIAPGTQDVPEAAIDGMTYITYGEQNDEVAFEITDDLEEALEIMEQMQDDGFRVKLFQAQEIDVVKE